MSIGLLLLAMIVCLPAAGDDAELGKGRTGSRFEQVPLPPAEAKRVAEEKLRREAKEKSLTLAEQVGLAIALVLAAGLGIRKVLSSRADSAEERLNLSPAAEAAIAATDGIVEDGPEVSFEAAPIIEPSVPKVIAPVVKESKIPAKSLTPEEKIANFFENAGKELAVLRNLALEASEANEALRDGLLRQMLTQAQLLKGLSAVPVARPAWEIASALEGMLTQITTKREDFTSSALQTVAGALDVLGHLIVQGVRMDLTTKPAVRLLAVDDDATSLRALAMVLKKDFSEPNVAAEGEAALKLAGEHLYDVIFMDIEMPGRDGFEVCEKIHETMPNKATPVVFVSRHSDIKMREKSVLSGGIDFIAKPFLSSEVRLKTLALVCRSRLEQASAGDVLQETGVESNLAVTSGNSGA